MKICLVPTMFPKFKGDYYGSFVFDDARMLVEKGFEVHVVTQHNPGIPYEEIIDGIHVHRFKWMEPNEFKALVHFKGLKDNFRLITYLVSLFFNLIFILRNYKIDIIHAHSVVPTGLIGVIVAKIMKKPIFITTHGMDITNFEHSSFFKGLIKFSLNNSTKAIAVSENIAQKMISFNLDSNKVIIIRNAVDINRFKPTNNKRIRFKYNIEDNIILIIFVGYLDTFKGVFELFDAFKGINKTKNLATLMMVGTGPKKDELKKKTSELGLNEQIIFTGEISPSDIHEYYQSADIFVLPSHIDSGGPPIAVIEAMACGLPVIGSDVGGIPEGIDNGWNGFIVPPKNVDSLIEKLKILVNDEKLRKKFGNNSLKKIHEDSMTLDNKAKKLINLYKNRL